MGLDIKNRNINIKLISFDNNLNITCVRFELDDYHPIETYISSWLCKNIKLYKKIKILNYIKNI